MQPHNYRRDLLHTAELVADQMRALSSVSNHRVHLHSVARRMGVASISNSRTVIPDGQMHWVDGRPHITIRADMSANRRRFTLAHELAHVMLGHGGLRERSAKTDAGLADEERLCDAIAGALLIPKSAAEDFINVGDFSCWAVEDAAEFHGVSRAAFVIRVSDLLTDGSFALVELNQRGANYELVKMCGSVGYRKKDLKFIRAAMGTPIQNNRDEYSSGMLVFDHEGNNVVMQGHGRIRMRAGLRMISFVTHQVNSHDRLLDVYIDSDEDLWEEADDHESDDPLTSSDLWRLDYADFDGPSASVIPPQLGPDSQGGFGPRSVD